MYVYKYATIEKQTPDTVYVRTCSEFNKKSGVHIPVILDLMTLIM